MQKILALRDLHQAVGNSDAAGVAQREYDRLVRNDDRLLDQIDELQKRSHRLKMRIANMMVADCAL
jgi:hypothetical protein